jgi:hypothetical protein
MTEDQLEGVIAPGGSIDSQAAGMNSLDPQGKFVAMQGSGGSQQAMFNAIKASIDNGTGSTLNVATGSSLGGHTFAPGHFIAATGYNPDGTINVSDTAGGRTYAVSPADAFQATQGRGIVTGTGSGPIPGMAAPGPQPAPPSPGPLPGILNNLLGPGANTPANPFLPAGAAGFATGGAVAASDTVPAWLTPGEEVVKKDAAQKYRPELEAMNAGQDPHWPTPDRVSPSVTGPGPSSRGPLGSVTPPPPGPRIGQGQGPGFGISGGLIGMAETAAIMAAMGAGGMAIGGIVPDAPSAGTPAGAPAGGGTTGGKGGAPSGGGDPMTAVVNRTVGLFGQYGGIAAQGVISSLIPGASQKGGISDGGILSKLAGGMAGAHPSAPNTAGNTAVPLPPPGGSGSGGGDTHNHIGTQAGVSIGTMHVGSADDGKKVADDLAFQSYVGYGGR